MTISGGLDPCEDCIAEQAERDRYYDEIYERKQAERAFIESDTQQQDPFYWALNEIDKIFARAKVMKMMKKLLFTEMLIGQHYQSNGTLYVKRSSRTARILTGRCAGKVKHERNGRFVLVDCRECAEIMEKLIK